MPDHD